MIKVAESLEEFKKEVGKLKIDVNIDEIIKIDIPFLESQGKFTILHIPSYGLEKTNNLIFVAKRRTIIYAFNKNGKIDKKFEALIKKRNGESTISIFILLKLILKNYSYEFVRIRDEMNKLELDPVLDIIEETGRQLRKLTDRMEGLFQIIIELKEEEINCFDVSLVNFDYEILSSEARYLLERCRSHVYRIASLRTKSEMKSNKELNDTMKKLTVIMTFLTIVSIVVNVPGTIGAIFGIPALSDAYFEGHTTLLVLTLISTTILSILLGFFYWKSLKLKS